MSSQFLLEFGHKKGDFTIFESLCLFMRGLVNDLDPGLQSAVAFGEPLGYLPDGDTQRSILW